MDLKRVMYGLADKANKYSPELLIGFGIAAYLTSIILAVKATPKAEDLIVQAEDEKEDALTIVETVKAAWKPYVPPALTFMIGTGAVICGLKIKNDRFAETATALAVSQAIVNKYQEKTEELAGKEKADEIDKEVRKDVARNMAKDSVNALPPSNIAGVHPFWDPFSNTAFYIALPNLKNAEVELNRRLYTGSEPYVTYDDLYDELNEQGAYPPLKHTAISHEYGWTPDMGGIEFDIDHDGIPFEHDHWTDGTPCYVMSFKRFRSPEYLR